MTEQEREQRWRVEQAMHTVLGLHGSYLPSGRERSFAEALEIVRERFPVVAAGAEFARQAHKVWSAESHFCLRRSEMSQTATTTTTELLADLDQNLDELRTIRKERIELTDLQRDGFEVDPESGKGVKHLLVDVDRELSSLQGIRRQLVDELQARKDHRAKDPTYVTHRDSLLSQVQSAAQARRDASEDRQRIEGLLQIAVRGAAESSRGKDGSKLLGEVIARAESDQYHNDKIAQLKIQVDECKRIEQEALRALADARRRMFDLTLESLELSTEGVMTVRPTGEPVKVVAHEVLSLVCHPHMDTSIPACLATAANALVDAGLLVVKKSKK